MKKYSFLLTAFLLFVPFCKATDGDLDTTFNPGGATPGKIEVSASAGEDTGYFISELPDGKIIVAVQIGADGGSGVMGALRLNSNGTLDTTYNANGSIPGVASLGIGFELRDGAVQPDGKLVCAGVIDVAGDPAAAICRFTADGLVDKSFGAGLGYVTFNRGTGTTDYARKVIVQNDGKIIFAGEIALGAATTRAVIGRLNPDGTLDTTFAGSGLREEVFPSIATSTGYRYNSVIRTASGKYLCTGAAILPGGGDDPAIFVRYNSDGSLDTSFGSDGPGITLNNLGPNPAEEVSMAARELSDGKIVGIGRSASTVNSTVLRLNADGTPDKTFGAAGSPGLWQIDVVLAPATTEFALWDFVIQPDSKIIMVGHITNASGTRMIAIRFTESGQPDSTFGSTFGIDGVIVDDFDGVIGDPDFAFACSLQADGKLLMAGRTGTGAAGNVAVSRRLVGSVVGNASALGSSLRRKYAALLV